MDPKLLNKVRRYILIQRGADDRERISIGLSRICMAIDGNRGHIQRCLSLLAKEGIMYERQRPECAVAPYEHGETDKHFRIRISKDDAITKLHELGIKTTKP